MNEDEPWLFSEVEHTPTAAQLAKLERHAQFRAGRLAQPDSYGCLPLHCAAAYLRGKHAAAVIETVHAAYKPAVAYQNKAKILALHFAAVVQRGKYGNDVVATLIAASPDGVYAKDIDGNVPLHNATHGRQAELALAIVTTLLGHNRESAKELNDNGNLPLHSAAANQKGKHAVAVVKKLLEAFPDGAKKKDKHGNLPLHFAAAQQRGKYGRAVIEVLLAAYPEGIHETDNDNMAPLEYASDALFEEVLREAAEKQEKQSQLVAPPLSPMQHHLLHRMVLRLRRGYRRRHVLVALLVRAAPTTMRTTLMVLGIAVHRGSCEQLP